MNILAISRLFPRPDTAAGDRRFVALLSHLTKNHQVDFCCTVEENSADIQSRYAPALRKSGVRVVSTGDWRGTRRAALRRLYDIVICEFWSAASDNGWLLRCLQPWTKIVVDTVDVHFLREEAGLIHGYLDERTVAANKQAELRVYQEADAILLITHDDMRSLEAFVEVRERCLIPNVLSIRQRPTLSRDRSLLFIGGFHHTPNVDGLLWFVHEVWPAVRSEMPDVRLTVIGSHPKPEILALGQFVGINVVGYVPDTAPYLDLAAVSVGPLRYGAGMKGKVTEAMASALPVVTTSVGAQGLGAISGEHLVIADDPEGFASGVLGLLRDPDHAERIGRSGQSLISSICSPDVVGHRLEEFLEGLRGARPRIPPARWLRESVKDRIGTLARLPLRIPVVESVWDSVKSHCSNPRQYSARTERVLPGGSVDSVSNKT